MKKKLMSRFFGTIVTGSETDTRDTSPEAKRANLHHKHTALSTFVMAMSENCLSATAGTERYFKLLYELKGQVRSASLVNRTCPHHGVSPGPYSRR